MAKIDISELSIADLKELRDEVSNRLEAIASERRAELLRELKELDDISADPRNKARPTPPKRTAEKKYVSSTGVEWSGLGRRPIWVDEHIEAGGNLEDLLIDKKKKS